MTENPAQIDDDGTSPDVVRSLQKAYADREAVEDELRESLRHKEILLRELHHRVKNSLQVVASLLRIQSTEVEDENVRAALRDSRERILTIARVHQCLHGSDDPSEVRFGRYLRGLARDLAAGGREDVAVRVEVEPISLDLDTAVPCGLIVNELVSNGLRHAYPDGNGGDVTVRMTAGPSGALRLEVSDDGVGLPEGLDPADAASVGMSLIRQLARQVGGRVEFDRTGPGTDVRLTVPADGGRPETAR